MPTPTPTSPPLLTAEEKEAIEGRDAQFVDLFPEHMQDWAAKDRRRLLQAYSAMEKERDAARKDRDFWNGQAVNLPEQLARAEDARDALSARCAGLEKDAARYRWLKEAGRLTDLHVDLFSVKSLDEHYVAIDAAIDAALEAK